MGVDDAGNILASWDCGSSLSIAYGADRAHRVASDAEIKVSLDWLGKRQREATSARSERLPLPQVRREAGFLRAPCPEQTGGYYHL